MLYGLAIVPVLLFLMNGISLRHYALVAASLLFMTIENSQSVFSIVYWICKGGRKNAFSALY